MDATDKRVKAFALWENESSKGHKYFTGTWGNLKVVIFKQDKKGNDKAPDWQAYFYEMPPKDGKGYVVRRDPNKDRDPEGGDFPPPF